MIYNKKLILWLAIIFFSVLKSQENLVANYTLRFKSDSTDTKYTYKNFVLLHYPQSKESFFLSREKFENDSIKLKQLPNQETSKNFDFGYMVKKDFNKNYIFRYEKLLNKLFTINVKAPSNWNIQKETKKIGAFNVQKACLDYKGRSWIAWFAPDIPIFDGPYVFSGLPGLVIEIMDTKYNYLFTLSSLKSTRFQMFPIMSLKPIAVTIDEYKKILINHYNEPFREMKYSNVNARWTDENGKEFTPDYRELTKSEQQAIRKYNNPIELSEAINYK